MTVQLLGNMATEDMVWKYFGSFSPVRHNDVCAKYWPMGFYSEENGQTEAHEPLSGWASGRKAPCTGSIDLPNHYALMMIENTTHPRHKHPR